MSFSRSLYAEAALLATAEAYSELAQVELVERGPDFELRVSVAEGEPSEELLDELSNHALYETVQRFRAAGGVANGT